MAEPEVKESMAVLEVDEGGTPVGKASTTSIAQFLAANPRLATIKAKRDSNGVIKWLLVLIFAYLGVSLRAAKTTGDMGGITITRKRNHT